MPTQADYPYQEYRLYVVLHKKEKRRMACLVKPGSRERLTLSYAKYLMSVHLGRVMLRDETVDHVNGDKLDDRLENFQILSAKANREKYVADNPAELVHLTCKKCGLAFVRSKSHAYKHTHLGKPSYCSRSCSGNVNMGSYKSLSDTVVAEIKRLHASGVATSGIALALGVSGNTIRKYRV